MDESYKNGRVMCVGGWLCEKETWKDIESKWAAIIQYERRMSERKGLPPISRYHATDCASLRRAFDRSKGWDEDRQIRFVKKLIDIIGQIRPIGIAVGCSLDDTRKVFGSHQEAEAWAYRICMMWCMDLIGELIDENWSGEKVDFFHEQSDRFNSVAQSAFKAMTANDSPHRKYFSSMTAVRWQDHIATQPADMLAFEAFKVINLDIASGEHLGDEPTDTEKMRKSLQSIIGKRVPLRVRYYTERIFREVEKRKKNTARRDQLMMTAAQLLGVNATKEKL
jgi:hypothetical protein